MNINDLKKKFPVIYGRDHSSKITLSDIVSRIGTALDAEASEESRRYIACDIIDRDFLFGAWGDRWTEADLLLLKDLRGLIIQAYKAGQKAAHGKVV